MRFVQTTIAIIVFIIKRTAFSGCSSGARASLVYFTLINSVVIMLKVMAEEIAAKTADAATASAATKAVDDRVFRITEESESALNIASSFLV